YFIPDREKDGHGLNSNTLVKLMTTKKPKVIITVDCGVSDIEQVNFINSFKIDVIITDHHEAPEELPKALAVINPKAQNALDEKLSAKEILNLTSLAGVGVAFKLAQAVLEHYKKTEFVYELITYVTVGTIADIVPLIGENRYFVTKGLQLISSGKHFGLKKLLESAGYNLEQGITSEQIAFGVAPRINASGRLDTTEDALKVLISDNKQEIDMAIISLNNFNKIRQDLCESIFLEAEEMLKIQGNQDNAIILFNPQWHIGIIGIVASKLVEKYYKPTFLMTYSEETKQIRCSSRGINEVNIYDVLSVNCELFDGFGGHALAGGFAFNTEKISFEEVKKALNKTIDEILDGKKLSPVLHVDLQIEPSDVNGNLISDLERLQPFGAANPNPIFALNNLTLLQKKLMGSNKNHLKLVVEDSQHNTYDCIWWSKGDISLNSGDVLDIAFCPQLNTFNGSTTIQLILQDIHADNLKNNEINESEKSTQIKVYDHRKKTGIFASVEDYVRTSNLNIAVFAEEKSVLDKLKPYKALHEKVFNRHNAQKADVVMFFDYPPNQEVFEEILTKTMPKSLHFMNYEVKKIDEKEFLKTFSGMLKFAYGNKNGNFNLHRSAAFLAQTKETIIQLLNVFSEMEMIKVNEKGTKDYKIEFMTNGEISKALHTNSYKNFLDEVQKSYEYKESLLCTELNNLCN
ncbi:MAG: single-stranded-DNA-specific exonuclease RecJ, partial [Candidatus Gastranaerophilales bacterium]|nr:single-stranded-DNA-specific exonuclease RecJ [Candidatus Gastranaerophilales bacterium]